MFCFLALNHMNMVPLSVNTMESMNFDVKNVSMPEVNEFDMATPSYVSSAVVVPFTCNYSLASDSTSLPIQNHIKVEINTKEPNAEILGNENQATLHSKCLTSLTIDAQTSLENDLNNSFNDSISPQSQGSITGLASTANSSTDSTGRATRHSARQQQMQQERMERKRKQDQLQTPTTSSTQRSSSLSSTTSKKSNSISPKVF